MRCPRLTRRARLQNAPAATVALLLFVVGATAPATPDDAFTLETRRHIETGDEQAPWRAVRETVRWDARHTAVIVCDMWDQHWCQSLAARTAEMAPRVDAFVRAAREAGAFVIHAPSDTMTHYEDHPARRRALEAPCAENLPEGVAQGCNWIDDREQGAGMPVDAGSGCPCDPPCQTAAPWTRQIEAIAIQNEDAITDSGVEVWNLLESRDIEHVLFCGVHTNICVVGRPFGLRNLARFGKDVALVRDLTDAAYDIRRAPHVGSWTATDLVVEHIEKYISPTVLSTDITGEQPFRFAEDKRPFVVFVVAEDEYGARQTMPLLADDLRLHHGMKTEVVQNAPDSRHNLPGLRVLQWADGMVLFMRRRAPRQEQLQEIRDYLQRGGPLTAFRTSSHAFGSDAPEGHANWYSFDRDVLGCQYGGHLGRAKGKTVVELVPGMEAHPVLRGFPGDGYESTSWMYRSRPLTPDCRVLLTGHVRSRDPYQPLAWTTEHEGGRVFYTSLGHPDDFEVEGFHRLAVNAVQWMLGLEPPEWKDN